MAACTPIPTRTLFTTTTVSTSSVSTSIFDRVETSTITETFTSTRCLVSATASDEPPCLSSTVIISTTVTPVVTTIPQTRLTTVPVFVPITNAVQTFYSQCPDQPPPPTTPTDETTSSSLSTIIRTEYSTYTDSNGTHTKSTTISSTNTPLNSGGSGNKNSVPLGGIIGGVVGGLIGLIALIALVWYLLWRRKQVKYLFDDDDDDHYGATTAGVAGAGGGLKATALLNRNSQHHGYNSHGRRVSRNLNLDDEIKGADAHPYQYGIVGGTPSPNGTTPSGGYHSQNSTTGYGGGHHRSGSRDALMNAHSPPVSPRHLDVPLPGGAAGQYTGGMNRRASQYTGSSGMTETMMMSNQPPVGVATSHNIGVGVGGGMGGRVSDERDAPWMSHHPRPSSSLLEVAPVSYPPGHGGFYQQYGPIDPSIQPTQQQQPVLSYVQPPNTAPPPGAGVMGGGGGMGGGIHKPPLEPSLTPATRPIPAHQALYAATGLGSAEPYSPSIATTSSSASRAHMFASPPPGAAGAKQYPPIPNTGGSGMAGGGGSRGTDPFAAVMATGDAAAANTYASSTETGVGFGRQQRSGEKSPEPRSEGPRSPVIQHQDGGRVPMSSTVSMSASDGAGQAPGSGANTADGHVTDAPPPAYSDP